MSLGIYQSAATLSALERWQDVVAQNITSSQITGYRKRSVSVSTQNSGTIEAGTNNPNQQDVGVPMVFSRVETSVNFTTGETQPTRRELDVAIQGEGFFEIQMADGSSAYTRNGEFRVRPDRTLVTSSDNEVLNDAGSPIVLLPGGGSVSINQDGTIYQGGTLLGHLSVQKFADNKALIPLNAGYFIPAAGAGPEPVEEPVLLQGYLEGSNVTPLREMVDMVLISRAYEANQRIITAFDEELDKTLQALG